MRLPLSVVWCVLASWCVTTAQAQPVRRSSAQTLPALARYVSDQATVFIEIDNLGQIDRSFSSDKLWQVLCTLVGNDADSDWRKVLGEALGVEPEMAARELFSRRVALAALDWDHLAEGGVLFTLSSPQALRRIVGPGLDRSARRWGRARLFELKSGLWMITDDRTVMLSRKFGRNTLFGLSMDLIGGKSTRCLAKVRAFQDEMGQLPAPRYGSLFWTNRPGGSANEDQQDSLRSFWPTVSHGALGLYVGGRHVELILRGRSAEEAFRYQPRVVLPRITALPQTTLVAWATSIDVPQAYEAARESPPLPIIERLWELIRRHADSDRFREEIIANLGPRCLAIIGCDVTSDPLAPQIGVMFESVDATGVVEALYALVERIIQAVTPESGGEPPARLTITDHLGTTVYALRFAEALPESSGHDFASLVAKDLTLSFAAVRGWVVISASPTHISQIIEAANGLGASLGETLIPALGETLAPQQTSGYLNKSVIMGVLQPSFAADMFSYWAALEQKRPPAAVAGRVRLGISVRTDPTPGQVIIAQVNSNGPSAGLLLPDDAVIACNDTLLNLDGANEHLKALMAQAPPGQPIRLRVMREKNLMEVSVLPTLAADKAADTTGYTEATGEDAEMDGSGPMASALKPLTSLRTLANELDLAIYCVSRPSHDTYHAQLVLQFQEWTPPRTPPVRETGTEEEEEETEQPTPEPAGDQP